MTNMEKNTVEFFQSFTHQSIPVVVAIDNYFIRLYPYPRDNKTEFKYKISQTHYDHSLNKTFIYLNKDRSNYLVIPTTSKYLYPLIGTIDLKSTAKQPIYSKWYVIAPFILLIFVGIYVFIDSAVPAIAMQFITPEQESKIGTTMYDAFASDMEIDSAKTKLVQSFADSYHLSKKYTVSVTVFKDTIMNAYALPGGHIIINEGILDKITKPEELVALLGHESTHINNRHSLKSIIKQLSFTLLISILTNNGNDFSKILIGKADMLRELGYSRELELEADNGGMHLMVNNTVNPLGMKWLMEDLKKHHYDLPKSLAFFSTHPLFDERIKNAADFSKKHGDLNKGLTGKPVKLWEEIKKQEVE